MMPRFVSIGECMIELSPGAGPDQWQQGIAGDTLNTAWYARAALPVEWSVDYVTRLGVDAFSDRMIDFMSHNGLGTDHIARDPSRQPGLYAISLVEGERSFTYWRSDSAARRLADNAEDLNRALQGARIAFVSGITLAILPVAGRETLLQALSEARAAGTQIAFDPNIRPRLWENIDSARDWLTRCAAISTIILPSFDDEAALFSDPHPRATIERYRNAGPDEVVVKNGGAGVFWSKDANEGAVTDLSLLKPVDTTGAGDSFNGAYLADRLLGADVPKAIHTGHAMAGRVILHRGALIGNGGAKLVHGSGGIVLLRAE